MSATATAGRSLPDDLGQLLAEFEAIELDADDLVSALSDEQFNWAPAAGRWSIGQCLAHLNAADAVYMQSIEHGVTAARCAGHVRRAPIASSLFGRTFLRVLEPPARLHFPAPPQIAPPTDRRSKAEIWPEFVRTHGHIRAAIAGMGDVDLNRARFVNPFVGRLVQVRVGTALRIMAGHDRRHVWQARTVREAPGFPH